jgi:hypothetical protein
MITVSRALFATIAEADSLMDMSRLSCGAIVTTKPSFVWSIISPGHFTTRTISGEKKNTRVTTPFALTSTSWEDFA